MTKQTFDTLVGAIVSEQEALIGQMAVTEANKVSGLKLDRNMKVITVEGSLDKVLLGLVEQYKKLFGQVSVEVCKDSVKEIVSSIPANEVPDFLR